MTTPIDTSAEAVEAMVRRVTSYAERGWADIEPAAMLLALLGERDALRHAFESTVLELERIKHPGEVVRINMPRKS